MVTSKWCAPRAPKYNLTTCPRQHQVPISLDKKLIVPTLARRIQSSAKLPCQLVNHDYTIKIGIESYATRTCVQAIICAAWSWHYDWWVKNHGRAVHSHTAMPWSFTQWKKPFNSSLLLDITWWKTLARELRQIYTCSSEFQARLLDHRDWLTYNQR